MYIFPFSLYTDIKIDEPDFYAEFDQDKKTVIGCTLSQTGFLSLQEFWYYWWWRYSKIQPVLDYFEFNVSGCTHGHVHTEAEGVAPKRLLFLTYNRSTCRCLFTMALLNHDCLKQMGFKLNVAPAIMKALFSTSLSDGQHLHTLVIYTFKKSIISVFETALG